MQSEILKKRIEEADEQDKPDLILKLRDIGSHKDIPFLKQLLDNQYYAIRCAVAITLAAIGNTDEILSILISLLDTPDIQVRLSSLNAIGQLRRNEAIPILEQLIENDSMQIIPWSSAPFKFIIALFNCSTNFFASFFDY